MPTGKSGLCSSCLTVGTVSHSLTVGHSSSFRHGWLRVSLPGDRRDHRRLLSQRAALGILRKYMESRSHIKCQVRLTKNSFSLSSRNFFPAPKHSVFKILSDLRFHKTSFPQNFFSTKLLCHKTSFPPSVTEGKNALCLPSLALTVRKPRKRGLANFAKYSSVLNAEFPANPLITKY